MADKINLELKHYCADFGPVREVLRRIGARHDVTKEQRDVFFDLPPGKAGRLKLRAEEGKRWLIYYERPDFEAARETASQVKLYEVRDGELEKFLEATLGVKALVEKTREVWRKANTVFHFDQVKGVGGIFEIELQKTGAITDEDRAIFANYQREVLPHLGSVIAGSNVDLVLEKNA